VDKIQELQRVGDMAGPQRPDGRWRDEIRPALPGQEHVNKPIETRNRFAREAEHRESFFAIGTEVVRTITPATGALSSALGFPGARIGVPTPRAPGRIARI
jgi:hypothetical protein